MTTLIICPGMHDPLWTETLRWQLDHGELWPSAYDVFPLHQRWAWSPHTLRLWLEATVELGSPLVFMGFSAGCVAAISAAWACQHRADYPVEAVIALDGWMVPLVGPFATYRLSHDRYTHITGALWGRGDQDFYADPAVTHPQLWQSPHQVWGWAGGAPGETTRQYMTALQFLRQCLCGHGGI